MGKSLFLKFPSVETRASGKLGIYFLRRAIKGLWSKPKLDKKEFRGFAERRFD